MMIVERVDEDTLVLRCESEEDRDALEAILEELTELEKEQKGDGDDSDDFADDDPD